MYRHNKVIEHDTPTTRTPVARAIGWSLAAAKTASVIHGMAAEIYVVFETCMLVPELCVNTTGKGKKRHKQDATQPPSGSKARQLKYSRLKSVGHVVIRKFLHSLAP